MVRRDIPDLAERLRLIVVTDAALAAPRSVIDVVSEALAAGAPAVQLRDKRQSPREVLLLAAEIRRETAARNALFFMNDRVDLALAAKADGVHVGPADLPVGAVREVGGTDLIVGYSASSAGEARQAVEEGADYIGCGSIYGTETKADAGKPIGVEGLARVVSAVSVPVVGIGGITPARAAAVRRAKAAGSAVALSVMTADDLPDVIGAFLAPWAIRSPKA